MDNPSYARTTMDPSDRHNTSGASGGTEGARGASTPINRSFQLNDSSNFMRHPSTELLTEETNYQHPPVTEYDPHPGGQTYNPSSTLNRDNLPYPPPSPRPTYTIPERAPMNEKSHPRICRSSMILNGILITGIVGGIIMTACIAAESNLVYVGPVILGLSVFGLCGKAYFTLFWEEDPLPMLNPYVEQFENKLGFEKDPYGHKKPKSAQAGVGTFGTEMHTFNYPVQSAPATVFTYPDPAPPPQYDYSGYGQDLGGQQAPAYQSPTPTYNSPTPTQEYNSPNTSRDYNIPTAPPK